MSLATALANPSAAPVVLATITVGVWCRAWVVDGTLTNTYKVALGERVTAVRWDGNASTLTQGSSAANVDATPSSWYWDGTYLWVRPPATIFDHTVQAVVTLYFGTKLKVLNSVCWEPRIIGAPNLSRRIEPVFGGVGQIGGGTLQLANADAYFNSKMDWRWDAGTVALKMGCDVHETEMDWADYEDIAFWHVENWSRKSGAFELQLVEPKSALKTRLPKTTFSRDDYPNIDDNLVGDPIPIAYGRLYGVEPKLVDPATKTFKVAGHAIHSLDAVRVRQRREEIANETTVGDDWFKHDTNTWRTYMPGVAIRNVTADGVSLEELNSLEDVEATAGSWTAEDNFVYVHPDSGETITSVEYVVTTARDVFSYQLSEFASKDLANGEFTMGADWTAGTVLSVDCQGKKDGSVLMSNVVDMIEDVLATAGETSINAASFAAAKAKLVHGTTEWGVTAEIAKCGFYIAEEVDAEKVVTRMLKIANAFLYIDEIGEYNIGVFEPSPGESLQVFTDLEILSFEENSEAEERISLVNGKYKNQIVEKNWQLADRERVANQYLAVKAEPENLTEELELWERRDTTYWAERVLQSRGVPLRIVTVTVPWVAFQLQPGNQVLVQSTRNEIDDVLEVLSVKLDLGTKLVQLQLGNLRNFGDAPGFWVADADVLPAKFSQLDGYGSGSLTWNASWDPEIKKWARQNVGYWTDSNGFASTSDPESHMLSVWF